ncbi:MarR family winged helix-turn-helix transcriptional regulator [Leifsonia sp. NPDC058248]|uniref:MarR family winged helix-turn-helix transcriptional regulator n=1 Tax=Leifsonia sp. NPDC058248 TaxID=3346402 RepID=UPI0036D889EF
MAVRHDQWRHRLQHRGEHGGGPGGHAAPGGFGGPFGGASWGGAPFGPGGPGGRAGYGGRGRGWHGHDGHDHDGHTGHDHNGHADHEGQADPGPDAGAVDSHSNARDAAGPGPRGRRGRPDGSLGRAARFRMLDALEAAEKAGTELSISAIADAVGVDQPRASRLVQEGVERGLVRRVTDPTDARRSIIQLTNAGRSQITEVRTHRRSAVEEAIAGFTPDEARTFADLFDRFVRAWPRD